MYVFLLFLFFFLPWKAKSLLWLRYKQCEPSFRSHIKLLITSLLIIFYLHNHGVKIDIPLYGPACARQAEVCMVENLKTQTKIMLKLQCGWNASHYFVPVSISLFFNYFIYNILKLPNFANLIYINVTIFVT